MYKYTHIHAYICIYSYATLMFCSIKCHMGQQSNKVTMSFEKVLIYYCSCHYSIFRYVDIHECHLSQVAFAYSVQHRTVLHKFIALQSHCQLLLGYSVGYTIQQELCDICTMQLSYAFLRVYSYQETHYCAYYMCVLPVNI